LTGGRKRLAANVPPQNVGSERRHVHVLEAVVVVVGDAHTACPPEAAHAGGFRDVGEPAAAVVAIQGHHRVPALGQLGQRGSAGEQRIHVAIVVEVEERDAVAGRVDDVVLGGRAGNVPERQPRGSGHVGEADGDLRGPQQCAAERRHDRRDRHSLQVGHAKGRSLLRLASW
jgi:hypothetical protein